MGCLELNWLRWYFFRSTDNVRDVIVLVFKRPLGDMYALFFGLVVGTCLTVGLVAAFVAGTLGIVVLFLLFVGGFTYLLAYCAAYNLYTFGKALKALTADGLERLA